MVIVLNMNLRLTGVAEQIMVGAVRAGLAKTKTDAILLGLVELDHRYHLLERLEELEDVGESDRILREVREGKQKIYSKNEFEKQTGAKLG